MADLLKRASGLIRNEGYLGAHSLLFLLRYASLEEDKMLLRQIGDELEELSSLPESAMLAYLYAEYAQAEKNDFCAPAARFLLDRCDEEDGMLLAAYAKCARVFGESRFLTRALDLASESVASPFTALGLLEIFRATHNGEYLNQAAECAWEVHARYADLFEAGEAYDLESPSANSALALVYDELYRITQEERWEKARQVQNRFISLLADRYPTRVSFGLCALLADEYPWRTVVCALPGGEIPPEVRGLLRFYSPLTEVVLVPAETKQAKVFLLKQGKLEAIPGI